MALKRKMILAFFANSIGFSLIAYAYGLYYVKFFLDIYHIKEYWFQMSQFIVLIFDLVMVPVFAFILEKDTIFTRTRREAILYSSPFLILVFLIPWFRWSYNPMIIGLHLLFGLIAWDGLITYTMFVQGALFTEMSLCNKDRMTLIRVANVGHIIGSGGMLILSVSSQNLQNIYAFQKAAVIIAIIALFLYGYTGLNAYTMYDLEGRDGRNVDQKCVIEDMPTRKSDQDFNSFCKLWKHFLKQKNFQVFLIINFLQEFHRTFLCNFMVVIGNHLVAGEDVPGKLKSIFFPSTKVLPMVFVILFSPMIEKFGYFSSIQASFIWKIIGGSVMYILGHDNHYVLLLFLLLDSIFATAAHSLFNLPISDICDVDMKENQRSHPKSSIVYGITTFCFKPAMTLLPLFTVAVLNRYGYTQHIEGNLLGAELELLLDIMFVLVCFLPIVIGTIQLIVWQYFTLHLRQGTNQQAFGLAVHKC